MKKHATLNRDLLDSVKEAFVAMPAGADPSLGAGPVAGGGMLTQAQAGPMGGTPPPMDPAMMGGGMPPAGGMPPMDPAMMGGGMPPMDPAMMGGAPPLPPAPMPGDMGGLPPEVSALMAGGQAGGGNITMSVSEFGDLLEKIIGSMKGGRAKAPAADANAAAPAGPAAPPAA